MPSRAWVAAEVGVRLATPLSDAEMDAVDTVGNLKEPIDDALRLLGYDEEDLSLVAHDSAAALLAVTRFTTIRTVLERISDRFDLNAGGDSFRLSQPIETLFKLLAKYEAEANYYVDTGDDIFTLDLSYKSGGEMREIFG